ncbi:putative sulfate exporter family transporter [uncultured Desulfovibrio sp.]|uniref:YeiH family protein n=1 Tax=Candidatus Desulfovibrio intestinavium TaxID=2838534 RepID=A0A9D2HM25_9BACT|nr:putative sulfate exporter family transporter [uncultured Desulfovibrio sp.]HJA77988.1 YeiH family protein [Candidatus Desulfovibrio intestinavium]
MTTKATFNEDKVALLLGSIIFILALGKFVGLDVLGWALKMGMWVGDPMKCWSSASKIIPGVGALFATYAFVAALLSFGVKLMNGNVGRFLAAFTVIFFIAVACYTIGANAYIAANPTQLQKQGIDWALGLSTEAGLILALIVGLIFGNVTPGFANWLRDACRPELFVKIAIVVLGAELGVKAAGASAFAGHVFFRGLCAIVEAYLLYWAVVYYVARKWFKFNKEWAAPLASGISICGVSAAIATGGAIRARPVVPIMVSSLVVVFTCIEMLILPFVASAFLHTEPMVAGGWMGLAVKSDGGAIASGAITEALILTKVAGLTGVQYEPGWIVMVTTTVKVFIDMFIGIWALVLAYIWTAKFDKTRGERAMTWGDVMERFPRFVLGYLATFVIMLAICLIEPNGPIHKIGNQVSGVANCFRVIFFLLTFFSIGVVSNFHKLREEGIGRLAVVYMVCLFGFIIWVGLFISYAFFHGMHPPVIGG